MVPQESHFWVLFDPEWSQNLVKSQFFVYFAKSFHWILMKVFFKVYRNYCLVLLHSILQNVSTKFTLNFFKLNGATFKSMQNMGPREAIWLDPFLPQIAPN